MAKFLDLWEGESLDYDSESEADLALCAILVFWLGPDVERIDRLFLRSGLGDRDKVADRPEYRLATIKKAIEGQGGVFWKPPESSVGTRATMTNQDHPGLYITQSRPRPVEVPLTTDGIGEEESIMNEQLIESREDWGQGGVMTEEVHQGISLALDLAKTSRGARPRPGKSPSSWPAS